MFKRGFGLEHSFVAAYPTPRLGISAPQAVSKISGCGGGDPHPIGGAHRGSTAHVCSCGNSVFVWGQCLPCFVSRRAESEGFGVPFHRDLGFFSVLTDEERFDRHGAPPPHPEVGVSASQAVRGVSGCGVGAPHPMGGACVRRNSVRIELGYLRCSLRYLCDN